MRRLRIGILSAVVAVAALAQTASEMPSSDVRRVGTRLACQCGCKDSVTSCSMLECGFSKPGKERIARMQAVGMTDDQIVRAFEQDYGAPYCVAGFGLGVIYLFVRKYYKPRPAAVAGSIELDDPALAKYKDQIEKEMSGLE